MVLNNWPFGFYLFGLLNLSQKSLLHNSFNRMFFQIFISTAVALLCVEKFWTYLR